MGGLADDELEAQQAETDEPDERPDPAEIDQADETPKNDPVPE
jgi:hypothetical protein